MNYRNSLSVIPMFLLAQLSWAEDSKERPGPAICASQEVLECTPVEGCTRVSVEDIDAPLFISIKPGDPNMLVTLPDGRHETTKAERREKVDNMFIFQGAEQTDPESKDGIGWTLAISEDTGRMSITAAGDEGAFVIFGACTLL